MTESEFDTPETDQSELDRVERGLRTKLADFSHRTEIQTQIGEAFYIWKNDPETLGEYASEEDVDDLTFAKFFDWFVYDFKLLDTEERMIERFYEEEGDSLSDTEKFLLGGWLDSSYSFFEVEGIIPKEGCRVRDLFTGEMLEIKDSASSEQVALSEIIAGRPLRVGGNTYFSGVISVYPQAFKPLIFDFFNREFKEYKKEFGRKRTLKEYLKDWGYLIGNYVEYVAKNPHFLSPEGGDFVLASAAYGVKDYKNVLKRLRGIKSVKEMGGGTDELRAFSWTKTDKSRISGTIEVERERLQVQCYSRDSLSKAKQLLEEHLGDSIIHEGDSLMQPDGLFSDKQTPATKKKKKLPSGVKRKGELDTVLDEYYDGWVDTPLEALDGRTPRQAAATKGGKEKLSLILDELQGFYDGAREVGEPYYDVRKLRKKLNLEQS